MSSTRVDNAGTAGTILAEWVDQVADRFDAAWRGGTAPRIADFLGDTSGSSRKALLEELVRIDLEYRCRSGESLKLEEYLQALPELLQADGSIADDLVRYAAKVRAQFSDCTLLMRVRCPHCGAAISGAGSTVPSVACLNCGGSFRVEAEPASDPSVIGARRTLGKFQLLQLLGQGSFGMVYKARDVELNRTVALKIPRTGSLASRTDEERFLREAQSAALLVHPHIVPVHEIAREGDMPYIISDYIEGQTLADVLAVRRLGFREAAALLARVADALDYAHGRNIVHRDITPRNILLDACGEPHLTDFGLAHRGDCTAVITLDGQILGTPAYMAPEQAAGESSRVDGRCDIYSLGVILYELLTGERPFRGNTRMLLHQVMQDEPRSPRRLIDRVPRDLETICLTAMAKAPGRRYGTARDLAADLRRYLNGEVIRARPVSATERWWRWCRRNPRVALSMAAVALSLLAGTGFSAWFAVQANERAKEAEAHAARARVRFSMAREAVDQFHTQVSNSEQLRAQALEALRQNLLQAAVDFYQRLVEEEAENVGVQAERGRAYIRLADLSRQLGQHDKAEAAYKEALAIFQQLTASYPAEATYQEDLARNHYSLGVLYRSIGRADSSKQSHEQALDIRRRLADAHPELPAYQLELAGTYQGLFDVYGDIGRKDLAERARQQQLAISKRLADAHPEVDAYQQIVASGYNNLAAFYVLTSRPALAEQAHLQDLAISKRLAEKHPDSPGYQQDLAKTLNNVALFYAYHMSGRLASAEEAQQQAVSIRQRLAAAHPGVPEYRQNLAKSWMNLGAFYFDIGRNDSAAHADHQAIALLRRLADAYPEVPEYAIGLGGSCCNLGDVLRDNGKPQEALEWYAQAIARNEAVLRNERRQFKAIRFLQSAYGNRAVALSKLGRLAEAEQALLRATELDRELSDGDGTEISYFRALVLARAGDHARATSEASRVAKKETKLGRSLYQLAAVYALSAARVQQPRSSADVKADTVREQYAVEAVRLLQRARTTGFFRIAAMVEQLKHDGDFASLHSRAEFRKLLAELESQTS